VVECQVSRWQNHVMTQRLHLQQMLLLLLLVLLLISLVLIVQLIKCLSKIVIWSINSDLS